MFGSGGAEAIDIALKSARHATQRRRMICIAALPITATRGLR